jgi:hypothetical protein
VDYISPAFSNTPPQVDFLGKLSNASTATWPAAYETLVSGLSILAKFIDTPEFSIDLIQGELSLSIVYFLAVAKRLYYPEFEESVKTAIAFQESNPETISNPSFALFVQFRGILDFADGRQYTLDSLGLLLRKSVINSLAETIFYIRLIKQRIPRESILVFTSVEDSLRKCFHGAVPLESIDVGPLIHYFTDNVIRPPEPHDDGLIPWESLIRVKIADFDLERRQLSGEDGWITRTVTRNHFERIFADRKTLTVKPKTIKFLNEFRLDELSVKTTGRYINSYQVGTLLFKLANFHKVPSLLISKIDTVYASKFKPRKFEYENIEPIEEFPPPSNHQVFSELRAAEIGSIVSPIDFQIAPREELRAGFLFAVSRFIEIISPDNIQPFINFLDSFERSKIRSDLYSWLFINFNPLEIGQHFFARYFTSVTQYIQLAIDTDDKSRFNLLLKTLDYLITIAYVIILARAARKRIAHETHESLVIDFSRTVSSAIALFSGYSISKVINNDFVSFLDLIAGHLTSDVFHNIYGFYLTALVSAPLRSFALIFALKSIRELTTRPTFLDAFGRINSPIPELLANLYRQAFTTNNTEIISKYSIVFAEIARILEAAGTAAPRRTNGLARLASAAGNPEHYRRVAAAIPVDRPHGHP